MEILNGYEIEWMLELNSIHGYSDEVINLRGQFIPVIDLRADNELNVIKPEIAIRVVKKGNLILAFFVQPIKEIYC